MQSKYLTSQYLVAFIIFVNIDEIDLHSHGLLSVDNVTLIPVIFYPLMHILANLTYSLFSLKNLNNKVYVELIFMIVFVILI